MLRAGCPAARCLTSLVVASWPQREKYLDVLLKEAGLKPKEVEKADTMNLESAMRVIQLNERGRQGRQRAKFMKDIRANEE